MKINVMITRERFTTEHTEGTETKTEEERREKERREKERREKERREKERREEREISFQFFSLFLSAFVSVPSVCSVVNLSL
ncbi:MAG: hypothetical protein JOZ63_08950 [Planctomycetaceae bacterium]|nr:hypothetical protein [Planctomycetaceae bacterium]